MGTLKKPLRKNVALAIDGGGIKGVMVARALMKLEEATGKPLTDLFQLSSGTSTGAVISSAVAHGMDAKTILDVYLALGPSVFAKSWRTLPVINVLVSYRFPSDPFMAVLKEYLGDITLGELHQKRPDFNLVLTTTDLYAAQTRFIKLYKDRYADWRLRDATMASCIVPTIFPAFEHDYKKLPGDPPEDDWIPSRRYWLDGGVGSYSNPCYMAAYEAAFCLRSQGWDVSNTTLISIGTGIDPMQKVWDKRLHGLFGIPRKPSDFLGPEWAYPTIETFLHDADLQQIRLVRYFFSEAVAARAGNPEAGLDFRRFNIHFKEPIAMENIDAIPALIEYGDKLGDMILDDIQEDAGDFACGDPMAFAG